MTEGTAPAPIRDAASVLLVRDTADGPAVLMGQRGAGAAFMPNKFVFPGGAVDAEDAGIPLHALPDAATLERLANGAGAPDLPRALATAAIRELWEEAGLILGTRGPWASTVPPDWQGFATTGHIPDASALRYVFRAITPPGRPRRFDARFFLADATALSSDPDDFSRAHDELSNLTWVSIAQARMLNLPFITEVVLAEVAAFLRAGGDSPASVPFFDNSGPQSRFTRIQ